MTTFRIVIWPACSTQENELQTKELFAARCAVADASVETKEGNQLEFVADIVAAFVARNTVAATDLAALIQSVYATLGKLRTAPESVVVEEQKPAVPIKRSVTPDFIICLEDGKKLKSLKRHLRSVYDLTPDDYRNKWGLSRDYPMVAPAYAAARSELAKAMGLGQVRKKVEERAAPARKTPARRKAAVS